MIYKKLEDKNVITVNEGFVSPILEETIKRLETPEKGQVPEDYAKTISKIMTDLEESLKMKVGSGALDAGLGKGFINLRNAKERILKKDPKYNYSIIIPAGYGVNDYELNKSIEKVLTSNGFKKGGRLAGGWGTYFFKKGANKTIYTLSWYKVEHQYQIQCLCIVDNETNLDFIKTNHESTSIFSSIELL